MPTTMSVKSDDAIYGYFDGSEYGDSGAISWYQLADIAKNEDDIHVLSFALKHISYHEEAVRRNAYCQCCRMCEDLERNTRDEMMESIIEYIKYSRNAELQKLAIEHKIYEKYDDDDREEAATIIQEWWLKVCYNPNRVRRATQTTVAESFASDMKRLL